MSRRKYENAKAFTLIELMIGAVLAVIVVLGLGMVLSDSHRGWNAMYNRIYSDVVTDSHVARRMFDATVRRASSQGYIVDESGGAVEVYYYSDPNVSVVDRYARFFVGDQQLYMELGQLNPKQTLFVKSVCANVSNCIFKASGKSLQMFLTLNNGSQEMTTVTSAVMHN